MEEEPLHSIRFKRAGVEFEMTAAPADVAKVWESLEQSVVAAFLDEDSDESHLPGRANNGQAPEKEEKSKAKRKGGGRKRSTRKSAAKAGEDEVLKTLLAAPLDNFPELGADPKALYAAYATLSWAEQELNLEGLTASEIQGFLSKKMRLKNTVAAYRNAMKARNKAVDFAGSPERFRLMAPGKRSLESYLQVMSDGGTVSEAEQAGTKAEKR